MLTDVSEDLTASIIVTVTALIMEAISISEMCINIYQAT
jgi:hypothetical protein